MANKLIKTLTIDGTARDVDNCRFPKIVQARNWESPASAMPNHDYHYSFFSATEGGIVIATGRVDFAVNPYGYRRVTIDKLIDGAYVGTGASVTVTAPSNTSAQLEATAIFKIDAGESAILTFSHGSSSNVDTTVFARYVFIPDVVGGVVRHLKNLICYRPLNFGKAVA